MLSMFLQTCRARANAKHCQAGCRVPTFSDFPSHQERCTATCCKRLCGPKKLIQGNLEAHSLREIKNYFCFQKIVPRGTHWVSVLVANLPDHVNTCHDKLGTCVGGGASCQNSATSYACHQKPDSTTGDSSATSNASNTSHSQCCYPPPLSSLSAPTASKTRLCSILCCCELT